MRPFLTNLLFYYTVGLRKGAKIIREADFLITDKEAAMKLRGIGEHIGGYIEELRSTGSIKHLEELRAGKA